MDGKSEDTCGNIKKERRKKESYSSAESKEIFQKWQEPSD